MKIFLRTVMQCIKQMCLKIHCNTKYTTNRNSRKIFIKSNKHLLINSSIRLNKLMLIYSQWKCCASTHMLVQCVSVEYVRTYLQPVGHLWKLCNGWLFVHKLVPIQVSKFVSIEAHPEVGPKHPLTLLLIKSAIINTCFTSFTWPNHTLATYMQKKFKFVINSSNKGQFKCK